MGPKQNNLCYKIPYYPVPGGNEKDKVIYLDYQSTTPLDPRVIDKMYQTMQTDIGNPHSRSHLYGWQAEEIVELARKNIADVINCEPSEIIFTSGATESNNIAIKGIARFYKDTNKNHIIIPTTEHKCVIESSRALEQEGFEVTYINPEKNGILDIEKISQAIKPSTILISVMGVNNEIGVIQPLKEIGKLAKSKNIYFHTDCAQAFGKIPLDVADMNIDSMSISAHKIYGPKGIGALYIRKKPRLRIKPLLSGGGQERGLRSGTLSPFLCAGFGEAAKIAKTEMSADLEHVKKLGTTLYNEISKIPEVFLNGDLIQRYPGNYNFSFAYVEGESLMMAIKNVAVSSGSACTSASLEPSYVLGAIGIKDELAHSSIRFGIGRFTTEEEILIATQSVQAAITKLRNMSPLWEMFEEGIDLSKIKWEHS